MAISVNILTGKGREEFCQSMNGLNGILADLTQTYLSINDVFLRFVAYLNV